MTTKEQELKALEQELKALEQIKEIVKSLGEGSYVDTAFEGCFEIAEENIRNDFVCSLKQKFESAKAEAERFERENSKLASMLADSQRKIKRLNSEIEKEQEWRDYEMKENVNQSDYLRLFEHGDTHYMTDNTAKDFLYGYGFAKEKIKILHTVPTFQINRHGMIRSIGVTERQPMYCSTDWNYIRFDCGEISYELYNGNLDFFVQ